MKRKTKIIAAIIFLFNLSGCTSPEKLVDVKHDDEREEHTLGYYTNEEIIFDHFIIQLNNESIFYKEDKIYLSIKFKLINIDVSESEKSNRTILEVSAQQDGQELILETTPTTENLFSEDTLEYVFQLNSPEKTVLVSYITRYQNELIKSREVFLE